MNAQQKEQRALALEAQLLAFHQSNIPLNGVAPPENMLAFVWQLIDSIQRVTYVTAVRARAVSAERADPRSPSFDPIRAAVAAGQTEEAFWLVFLATHCGYNLRTKWLLSAELYGASEAAPWTWVRVLNDPEAYADWVEDNHDTFIGKFGNHRKYESLKPGPKGTGAVVRSYVDWITGFGSHAAMVAQAQAQANGNARRAFNVLYEQMRAVMRFGRTGRFDYLTMLSKVGLANIEADSTYMNEATGPKRGARLLFDGQIDSNTGARVLEARVAALEQHLGVGMQVMEDAMCNWQKSPNLYQAFRG
jgi:Alpha-glutamyl/putrescinyl thymine pyrophosphorylase clade 3